MLAKGLEVWGLTLGQAPWRSKTLSLLPLPMKTSTMSYNQYIQTAPLNKLGISISNNNINSNRHPMPQAHPSTMIVIGVYGGVHSSEEGRNKVNMTVQRFAQYFSASYVTCVEE